MQEATSRNARIRDEGTRNLVRAAIAAGARRLIAQSIAWAYAPGPEPHRETDPLDTGAEGMRGISVRGVAALENRTLNSPPLEGLVLRYGRLYGPGRAPVSSQVRLPFMWMLRLMRRCLRSSKRQASTTLRSRTDPLRPTGPRRS